MTTLKIALLGVVAAIVPGPSIAEFLSTKTLGTTQQNPHPRYLADLETQFEYPHQPTVRVDEHISFTMALKHTDDEFGFKAYSVRFEWSWVVDEEDEASDVQGESRVEAAVDYRPTFIWPATDKLVYVAGVDRRGSCVIEKWRVGSHEQIEVRGAGGSLIRRVLVGGAVDQRTRVFHDISVLMEPISALSEEFVRDGRRHSYARTVPSGEIHRVTFGAGAAGTFVRIFRPEDIDPSTATGTESLHLARLRQLFSGDFLYMDVIRLADQPAAGDTTIQFVPHPWIAMGVPSLQLVDLGSNDSVDDYDIKPLPDQAGG